MTFINTSGVEFSLRRIWNYAGTPTSGTSGTFAGSAQPGDILSDTTNKKLYVNTNTAASPTWSQIVTAGVAFAGDLDITGDIDLGGEDISIDQGRAIYLDGQDGGEYITSDAANKLMLNATTEIDLAIGGTDEVAITATAVTLATNNLTLTAGELALSAGNASVVQGAVVYFDGQDGGEYISSDAANELMLNATTTLNLAIGGSDIISIAAATVTLNKDLAVTAGEFISGAPVKMLITNKTANTKYLTAAESGVIRATTDGIYLYLPTYIGNTGLTYFIKATASFSSGVAVYGYDATQNIDTANVWTSAAQSDCLGVIAHTQGWNIIEKIGTWA